MEFCTVLYSHVLVLCWRQSRKRLLICAHATSITERHRSRATLHTFNGPRALRSNGPISRQLRVPASKNDSLTAQKLDRPTTSPAEAPRPEGLRPPSQQVGAMTTTMQPDITPMGPKSMHDIYAVLRPSVLRRAVSLNPTWTILKRATDATLPRLSRIPRIGRAGAKIGRDDGRPGHGHFRRVDQPWAERQDGLYLGRQQIGAVPELRTRSSP
jgi:hypothetical protein